MIGIGRLGGRAVEPVGWFMALWGIPFVLMGLYVIVGRFFWDRHVRAKTFYGVATRSILIRQRRAVAVLDLASPPMVSMTRRGDRGTLTFGSAATPFGFAMPSGWPGGGRCQPPMFDLIEQTADVLRHIRDAQSVLRAR